MVIHNILTHDQNLPENTWMNIQIMIAFLAYSVIILTIGLISHRKQRNSQDFILGNRSLSFYVIALSAQASDMSVWLFMAFPAAVYVQGMPQAWVAIGLLVGMFCNWQFVSKRLRIMTEKYDCCTLSSFFEKRFGDNVGTIRWLTALMTVFFLTGYLAAGLAGMGLLFESFFQIDYSLGMTIATCVVLFYTFLGGFVAVAWTDLFQAIFLLAMIFLVPIVAFMTLPDGFNSILTAAHANKISLHLLPDMSMETIMTSVILTFGWGLGYFGQPHIVTKFMAIKNPEELYKSKYVGITWMLLVFIAAISVGLVGSAYFTTTLEDPQLVFIEMVKELFSPLLGGFVLCGVLSATITTMGSQILVCASVMSQDLYQEFYRPHASQKELLWITRAAVFLASVVSLAIALERNTTVLDAVSYAWAGLGCTFGPLVLFGLYSDRINHYGAIAGIIAGGFVGIFWNVINPYITDYAMMSMIPGFLVGSLSIYVVSLLTGGHKEQPKAELPTLPQ